MTADWDLGGEAEAMIPDPSGPGAAFEVQRAADPAVIEKASAAELGQPAGDRGSVGPSTAEMPPAKPADNLDDLAAKLYDKIKFRLRTDLRIDREHHGRLIGP